MTKDNFFTALFILFGILLVIFVVYDCSTGTNDPVLAVVIDKRYEVETSNTPVTDDKGNIIRWETDTIEYYWIVFTESGGKSDKYDVGYWKYNDFSVNQKIVVKYIVGGITGLRYRVGLDHFTGAESQ